MGGQITCVVEQRTCTEGKLKVMGMSDVRGVKS